MTKSELLGILYAERDRVEKQYAQPGWTIWAIVAAVASLGWQVWDMAEQCESWKYVIMVFYLLYFVELLLGLVYDSFLADHHVPMWLKPEIGNVVQSFLRMTLNAGLIVAQLLIIPITYYPVLYWASIVGETLFWLGSIILFIMCCKGTVGMSKTKKDVLLGLQFVPTIVLMVLFLCDMGYDGDLCRLGLMIYAIWYLLTLLPIGQRTQFKQIDALVEKVLYGSSEVNEKKVLRKMELYTMGVRYGRYLTTQKFKTKVDTIFKMVGCERSIIDAMHKDDYAKVATLIEEGRPYYNELKKFTNSVFVTIWAVYLKEEIDEAFQPIIRANHVSIACTRFWDELVIDEGTIEERKEKIYLMYRLMFDQPAVRNALNNEEVWDAFKLD